MTSETFTVTIVVVETPLRDLLFSQDETRWETNEKTEEVIRHSGNSHKTGDVHRDRTVLFP